MQDLVYLVKRLKKGILLIENSGIILKNNEIKNIIKVIWSLVNRGILLKGTTRKITSQEGGFLDFLRPLMTADLPLMKSLLTPLAKSVYQYDYQQECQQQMQLFKRKFMDQELRH